MKSEKWLLLTVHGRSLVFVHIFYHSLGQRSEIFVITVKVKDKAPDKRGYPDKYFFLFLHENIYCGYSLEAPQRGASNEYPQHMFSCTNKKNINIFQLKKVLYLELCKGSDMLVFCIAALA